MFYIFKRCISTTTGILIIKINVMLVISGLLVQIWNNSNSSYRSQLWRASNLQLISNSDTLYHVKDPHNSYEIRNESKSENITCVPPDLQLWPEDVKLLFKGDFQLQCSQVEPNWVIVQKGKFKFNKYILKKHRSITCTGWEITRDGDFEIKLKNKYSILDGMSIRSDFTEIRCRAETGKIYHNLLSGIKQIEKYKFSKQIINSSNNKSSRSNDTKPNIIIIGLDSMSRIHWKRTLPKTYKYFKNNLNGVILEGYNTLGGGTTAALLPLLTGQTEDQIPEARRGFLGAKQIDNLPWIWNTLDKSGYMTLWGEDGAASGTFQLRLLGFKNQPVDHYMRPFYLQAERYYKKFKPYCLGSIPRHVNMFNWMKEFVSTYPNKPKFGFIFHAEYSHHGNYEVQVIDHDLVDLLKFIARDEHTILLLMSDHGARFQDLRRTEQGSLEEKLPFFGLKFPKWFEKKYQLFMRNLITNTRRLTFPVDIHETLLHSVLRKNYHSNNNTKGKSLFNEIANDRTCDNVGVKTHQCACTKWKDISKIHSRDIPSLLKSSANAVIDKINSLTEKFSNYCSLLKLDKIISAQVSTTRQSKENKSIKLVFSVWPSKGQYEAIVESHGIRFVVERYDITRINKYGHQADCVAYHYPHLRPFCHCLDAV